TVQRQVPYSYVESVPVTTMQKQAQTFYTTVQRQVPYTYSVQVPVTVPVRQVRTVQRTIQRQVPYSWVESVPVTTVQRRVETYLARVPQTVTRTIPVKRKIQVEVCDPCTGEKRTVCKEICEYRPVSETILQSVPQTREVSVPVTTTQQVTR